MVFSSVEFLMIFLTILLILYFLPFAFRKNNYYKNTLLFLASIFFYAWGEREAVFLLLLSIVINWCSGIAIDAAHNKGKLVLKKVCMVTAVFYNLLMLFIFKYLGFALFNIGFLFGKNLNVDIALPIGISFYTFQIISYIADLYKGKISVQKNPIYLGLYVSLFPQLIAGPIVRYKDIELEITNRKETFTDFKEGLFRFVIGLGKKVLIANSVAYLSDMTFAASELSVVSAWLGAIAYTLQIYFDFSGYSDMAIGLGQMFGFHFGENFNYPYISKSITEFWRRWHMSLYGWFKDYIYIPLGGNRVSKLKNFRNIFIVWLFTGIWHGANWTFVVWGLMFFVLLMIEKYTSIKKMPVLLGHIYTMFFVIFGWVIFKSATLQDAWIYIGKMFSINATGFFDDNAAKYIGTYGMYMLIGILGAMPIGNYIKKVVSSKNNGAEIFKICRALYVAGIFVLSVAFTISSSYNPFIYFTF